MSMAAHAARRLAPMVANLRVILGVEAMGAAQGVEFRAPLRTSPALRGVLGTLRAVVPAIAEDRLLAPDIAAAAALVAEGALAADLDLPGLDAGSAA